MIFSKFSKPKWQHPHSDVRQSAIEEIDEPNILNDLAQNDDAVEVRKTAVLKINDLKVLDTIAQHDTDSNMREIADQRFKQLLCGQTKDSLSLESRLSWLNNTSDAKRIAYVAMHEQNVDLRKAAIEKIEQEEVLGDIAINDPISEIRLHTLEKLSQKTTLERVVKAVRNSDKRLSRRAREKLKEVIEQIERPARIQTECEDICAKLETLEQRLSSMPINNLKAFKQENTEFKRLQGRWPEISPFVSTPCQNSFTKIQQTVMVALKNYQQALQTAQEHEQALLPLRAAKKELCEQMESLLIDFKKYQTLTGEEETEFNQRFKTLQSRWVESPKVEAPEEEQQWQTTYQSIQNQQARLQASHALEKKLEAICIQAETLQNVSLKEEHLKKIQARWQEVLQSSSLFKELNKRFDNSLKALKNRLQEQEKQSIQAIPELTQLLNNMEDALEQGKLKTAITLEQKTRSLLKIIGLSIVQKKPLEQRLQTCHAKIHELQGWQRWGNKLERDKLCEQVENLLETEDDNPATLLRLIEEAQTAWKQLGTSGYSRKIWERFNKVCHAAYQRYREHLCLQMEYLSQQASDNPEAAAKMIRQAQTTWKELASQGHSQELWERFNDACQNAYAPCRTHFYIKSNERQRNFSEKEALCERLETFAKETEWENPNWKEVYQFVRETDKTWRNIGTTDRKLRKGIQRRFQSAILELENQLDVERHTNCRSRVHLMGEVEAMGNALFKFIKNHKDPKLIENQINETIESVKKMQAQWKVTVPGIRHVEHDFWKTFRSTCDVIFDHRKQQQETQKKEFQSFFKAKIALCEQVETLATSKGEAIKTALEQLQQFKNNWKQIQIDLNQMGSMRKKVRMVEERFIKACQKVEQQYQGQLATVRREQLDKLKLKADFCVELELADPQEDPDWISNKQSAWAALPILENTDLEAVIAQRFQQSCIATLPNADVLKTKETLCIRMEILGGLDSPPEAAETRLAYQVKRLSAAMTRGEKDSQVPQVEAEKIEQTWYLNGITQCDKITSLEQRFSKACEAFYSQQKK